MVARAWRTYPLSLAALVQLVDMMRLHARALAGLRGRELGHVLYGAQVQVQDAEYREALGILVCAIESEQQQLQQRQQQQQQQQGGVHEVWAQLVGGCTAVQPLQGSVAQGPTESVQHQADKLGAYLVRAAREAVAKGGRRGRGSGGVHQLELVGREEVVALGLVCAEVLLGAFGDVDLKESAALLLRAAEVLLAAASVRQGAVLLGRTHTAGGGDDERVVAEVVQEVGAAADRVEEQLMPVIPVAVLCYTGWKQNEVDRTRRNGEVKAWRGAGGQGRERLVERALGGRVAPGEVRGVVEVLRPGLLAQGGEAGEAWRAAVEAVEATAAAGEAAVRAGGEDRHPLVDLVGRGAVNSRVCVGE